MYCESLRSSRTAFVPFSCHRSWTSDFLHTTHMLVVLLCNVCFYGRTSGTCRTSLTSNYTCIPLSASIQLLSGYILVDHPWWIEREVHYSFDPCVSPRSVFGHTQLDNFLNLLLETTSVAQVVIYAYQLLFPH